LRITNLLAKIGLTDKGEGRMGGEPAPTVYSGSTKHGVLRMGGESCTNMEAGVAKGDNLVPVVAQVMASAVEMRPSLAQEHLALCFLFCARGWILRSTNAVSLSAVFG